MTKHVQFDAPELPPVLTCEPTAGGWRGLTAEGELLNVNGNGGIPDSLAILRNGETIGYRACPSRRTTAASSAICSISIALAR